MPATLFDQFDLPTLLRNPFLLLVTLFQIWMLVDAVRRGEWIWALFITIGWGLSALFYYLSVYRLDSHGLRGFELPGADNRRRIRQLQAQIHLLDNAHHHFLLGDVYFRQGQFAKAETAYRAALERDPHDADTRAHLGQCLLRLKRPSEALPLLEGVVEEQPEHDYGFTRMALAEALTALGRADEALPAWKQVTENHSYPRAKVQLAELYLARQQPALAQAELRNVVEDDLHAPSFQRRRDRVWVRRAKSLLRSL